MSNHHHLVVTDPRGVLPDFLRELHRLVAKAMNALQGRWENLWAAEPCNVVRLVTPEDVEEKIAYVVSNPVAAGLVREPEDWPGVLLWKSGELRVRRPASYFREDGTCPPELTLSVVMPAMCAGARRAVGDWAAIVARAVAAQVVDAQRVVAAGKRAFIGRAAVLASSFAQRALTREERFEVIPTFAAKARDVRDRLSRLEQFFRRSYRGALKRWRAGTRDVVFPFGTWGVVVFHSAIAETSGPR